MPNKGDKGEEKEKEVSSLVVADNEEKIKKEVFKYNCCIWSLHVCLSLDPSTMQVMLQSDLLQA